MVSWITVTSARLFKAAHLMLFLSFLGRQAVEVCPSPSTVNSASLQFPRGRLRTKQAESTTCYQPYRAHQELKVFVGEGGEQGRVKVTMMQTTTANTTDRLGAFGVMRDSTTP